MTKSEIRELATLMAMHALGGYTINIALGLSSLIRSARTKRSANALLEYAEVFGVKNHPNFKV